MGLIARLFGGGLVASSQPIEDQIAEYLLSRLSDADPAVMPTVIAARAMIADTVATMPMVAHDGHDRIVPTPSLLRRPDPREPYRATIEKICNSLTGWGNAWLRVYRVGSDGYPLAVRVVHPDRVTYRLSANGDEIVQVWVDGVEVDRRTIRHIPFRLDLGPIGESPIQQLRWMLEDLAAVYRWGSDYYTSGSAAAPPYVLKHPSRLTGAAAESFWASWERARNRRRPAVLSGGVELETFDPVSASDAMLQDAIRDFDAAIARVMLVPPSLLNVVSQSSLTYSTTLEELRRWLQLGLMPGYLSRIEAAFTDMLPRGTSAIIDTSNLVRMDAAGRIAMYAESIAAGIHNVREVRALEGLPDVPAADPEPVAPNVEGL